MTAWRRAIIEPLAVLPLLLLILLTHPAHAQYYELFAPPTTPYRVGDTLVFKGKLTGVEQMSPVTGRPVLAGPLPDGVRLVRVDSLVRIKLGHYEANLVFQFFRPGVQALPPLAVRARNLGADPGRMIPANADRIEIVPVLPPAGEPRPMDIRPLAPVGPPAWPVVAGGALLLAAAAWLARRWRAARARLAPPAPAAAPPLSPKDARELALARLDELDALALAESGAVARHYAETVDVVRDFLHAVRTTPRARAATAEVIAALARSAGLPAQAVSLLIEADYVKFAAIRPDAGSAKRFLDAAREVVTAWEADAALR